MSTSLIINHVLSFAVVMLCWWLAHLSASTQGAVGRVVSIAYGVLAVVTITVAIYRQFELNDEWVSVAFNMAIIVVFVGNTIFIHDRFLIRRKSTDSKEA